MQTVFKGACAEVQIYRQLTCRSCMFDVSHVYLYPADITVKCFGCPAYCCGESAVAFAANL